MRKFICMAGLLAAFVVVSKSPAQLPPGTVANPTTAPKQTSFIGPNSYLGSSFRLSDLIPSFRNPFATRAVIGTSAIPEPGSKAYFKAFGFRTVQ